MKNEIYAILNEILQNEVLYCIVESKWTPQL